MHDDNINKRDHGSYRCLAVTDPESAGIPAESDGKREERDEKGQSYRREKKPSHQGALMGYECVQMERKRQELGALWEIPLQSVPIAA